MPVQPENVTELPGQNMVSGSTVIEQTGDGFTVTECTFVATQVPRVAVTVTL